MIQIWFDGGSNFPNYDEDSNFNVLKFDSEEEFISWSTEKVRDEQDNPINKLFHTLKHAKRVWQVVEDDIMVEWNGETEELCLWDMPDNTGYINIVAVMQKFFDQGISGNWSYNPEHYPDNEVPVSVMAQDLLTTYKYGWKTSYYQNTHDMKTDEVEEDKPDLQSLIGELSNAKEEECESCAI